MPRIPMLTLDEMTPAQRAVAEAYSSGPRAKPVSGPTLSALHRPDMADAQQKLGAILRYGTKFPPRLSEFAILITARYWTCAYEWFAHEPLARKGGLSDAIIEALRRNEAPPGMAEDEQAVYDFAHGMHHDKQVSDAVYQRIVDLYGHVGVVELTGLIGYYALVAINLNAHKLEIPAGAPQPFPA
jgi:4-carboxymuconolactone decarboxylase